MKDGVTTFGQALRAYRLGYREYDRLRAWVRIAPVDEETVNITLSPYGLQVPKSKAKEHLCWWEGPPDVIRMIPDLKNVRRINRVISFDVLIDTGERVT